MVDYNTNVPAIQPMQQPNMMQAYGQMQQIQANRMLMQDRERALQERASIGEVVRDPNIDLSDPKNWNRLVKAAPTLAGGVIKDFATARREQRQGEVSVAELALKNADLLTKKGEQLREAFAKVAGFPEEQQPAIYANIIKQLPEDMRGLYSPVFSKSALRAAASTTAEVTQSLTPQLKTIGGRDVRVAPGGGPAEEILVQTAPPALAPTAQRDVRFEGVGQGTELPNVRGTVPVGPGAAAPGDAQAVINNMRAAPAQNVNQLAGRTVPASQLAAEASASAQRQELEKKRLEDLQDPKKRLELREKVGGAKKETEGAISTLNSGLESVNKVKAFSDEDLNSALGHVGANTPAVFATAKAVRTALNELKGIATAMAKTDAGKIGSMQVQEWEILRNQLVNLDYANMTPTQLREQVARVEARAKTLMDQARRGYSETYGAAAKELGGFSELPEGRKSAGITQAEYNALPSGSTYTDPNGNVRTKR